MRINKLHYITQPVAGLNYTELVEKVCSEGVKWVQLRIKDKPTEEIVKVAREVKIITEKYSAFLIINDNPEIASLVDADGVHLGKCDMHPKDARNLLGQEKIIGGTANSFEDILRIADYVDYIGLGPFRFTETKKNLSPVLGISGVAQIKKMCLESGIILPIIAIGGIKVDDLPEIFIAGADGIAVSSGINLSSEINIAAQKYLKTIESI